MLDTMEIQVTPVRIGGGRESETSEIVSGLRKVVVRVDFWVTKRGIPKGYFNWYYLQQQQQIGLILIFLFRNCLTTQVRKQVSCAYVLCIPKYTRKHLQCMWDLTVQFARRQPNEGADCRTTGLGHEHCCWTSALGLAAIQSPEGYHPLAPSKQALIQQVSNHNDNPENGNCTFKKEQIKHWTTYSKIPLPLPLTCQHKRMQSAMPSPTLATENKQNSWLLQDIYPAVKLVLLNYSNYLLMTVFRLPVRSVL